MKRSLLAATSVLGLAVVFPTAVGAGNGLPAPVVSPTSGPVGTTFTVEISGCEPTGAIPTIEVLARGTDDERQGAVGDEHTFEFTVLETTAPGAIDIEAQCVGMDPPAGPGQPPTVGSSQDYPVVQFTVTETSPPTDPPVPSTDPPADDTTTTAPDDEVTTTTTAPPAESVAATVVVETPTYTG